MQVKICGITDAAGLDAAAEADADWIGLNFFPRSPRFVDVATATMLARRLEAAGANRPKLVGLFVEPADQAVAEVVGAVPLDILQLYADAPRATALRTLSGLPVWRAHGVQSAADLPSVDAADGLVIESRPPAGTDRPGGNGAAFDWSVTRGWTAPVPWLLAGGLDPGNVALAIRRSGALAVDVASGVEHVRGIKDPTLIRRFIAAARHSG